MLRTIPCGHPGAGLQTVLDSLQGHDLLLRTRKQALVGPGWSPGLETLYLLLLLFFRAKNLGP